MEAGLPELWLIDIDDRTVEVWRPEAGEPQLVLDVLTWKVRSFSFELPLGQIFRGV